MSKSRMDPWRDILGIELDEARRAEIVEAYSSILDEIKKLRALNLTDVHPSVIFEPTAVYRNRKSQ